MKKENLVRISLAAVILVWVGIGVYFFYPKVIVKKRRSVSEPPAVVEEEKSSPFAQVSADSPPLKFTELKFKTYRNEELGFELQCPDNFVPLGYVNEPPDGVFARMAFHERNSSVTGIITLYVLEDSYEKQYSMLASEVKRDPGKSLEDLDVAGGAGVAISWEDAEVQIHKAIFPFPGGKCAIFSVSKDKGSADEYRKIFEHMLKTFEFI